MSFEPSRLVAVRTSPPSEQGLTEVAVQRIAGTASSRGCDVLAVEEPLEIRLEYGPATDRTGRSITVTMRTPGRDVELAVGFLFAEGVVRRRADIARAESCGPPAGSLGVRNIVRVELAPAVPVDERLVTRSFLATSSCGVCGKASLDALPGTDHPHLPGGFVAPPALVHALAQRRRQG